MSEIGYPELSPEPIAKSHNWKTPKQYDFKSVEEVLEASRRLDGASQEGFVCVDEAWNRVKVKSPQYVALAHLTEKDRRGMNVTCSMFYFIFFRKKCSIMKNDPIYRISPAGKAYG